MRPLTLVKLGSRVKDKHFPVCVRWVPTDPLFPQRPLQWVPRGRYRLSDGDDVYESLRTAGRTVYREGPSWHWTDRVLTRDRRPPRHSEDPVPPWRTRESTKSYLRSKRGTRLGVRGRPYPVSSTTAGVPSSHTWGSGGPTRLPDPTREVQVYS